MSDDKYIRPSWDDYFLDLAEVGKNQKKCLKK